MRQWIVAVQTGRTNRMGRRTGKKEEVFENYMIKIKPRAGESVQQLMKRFKRLCEKEGLTREIKRTSYYEKPSERRRRSRLKTLRRLRAAQAQDQ